ncbi:hypothetical protein MSPP1_001999 [Malassezia sp. CBS 17886]|nr:hypothetical protein MSPP1_001999 [Malassezia sp. CBS 17886]
MADVQQGADAHVSADDSQGSVLQLHAAHDDAAAEDMDDGTIRVWDEDSDDEGAARAPSPTRRTVLPFHAPWHRARDASLPQRSWWRTLLVGAAAPGTLSVGHVALNLFSSSLHPGVLLAMPVYFARTGVVPGMLVLVLVTILGAFGGGLWVTLGRYVGGNTVEAITGKAFGMNTPWKWKLGRALSGVLLAVYCTGAAVIAYHAMSDLLLQVFLHYSVRGDILHDRAFVTLVVGGALTLPMLVAATPKRSIIQIQSWTALLGYPAVAMILLAFVDDWVPPRRAQGVPTDAPVRAFLPAPLHATAGHADTWPWASTAMLPLLVLSASPAQVLAHNRSLRRRAAYVSNVKSFFLAQLGQFALIILTTYVYGVYIGVGVTARAHDGLHANFFAAMPLDDDYVNAARVLFSVLLAAHLCLCLASARSSWTRLRNLVTEQAPRLRATRTPPRPRAPSMLSLTPSPRQPPHDAARMVPPLALPQVHAAGVPEGRAAPWRKFVRTSLAGTLLWTVTALTAYFSGVGGVFRWSEKEGEELRFLRSLEMIGLLGAFVGFLLPALIWLVLFRIRRPRAILLTQSQAVHRQVRRYLLAPLSAITPAARREAGQREEHESLLGADVDADSDADASSPTVADEPASADEHPTPLAFTMPSHENEASSMNRDSATLILLARKERQLQQLTRGRRRYQEFLVVAALIPFGSFLIFSASYGLLAGDY